MTGMSRNGIHSQWIPVWNEQHLRPSVGLSEVRDRPHAVHSPIKLQNPSEGYQFETRKKREGKTCKTHFKAHRLVAGRPQTILTVQHLLLSARGEVHLVRHRENPASLNSLIIGIYHNREPDVSNLLTTSSNFSAMRFEWRPSSSFTELVTREFVSS